jgi:hypothetical protein
MAKVKPDQIQFNELMMKVGNGDVRIPDFQREFVWDRSQILKLLDSVYRHYPIGSFLFWETTDAIQSYRRVGDIDLQKGDGKKSVQYVLDGQQRITSLYASLQQATIVHRVNGRKVNKSLEIYFDLDEKEFVSEPFGDEDEAKFVQYRSSPPFEGVQSYLEFIHCLLTDMIDSEMNTDGVREWIQTESKTNKSNSRCIQGILWCMGIFQIENGVCSVTQRGADFLTDIRRQCRPYKAPLRIHALR